MARILLVRNDYDPITHYMAQWSVPIIKEAESKGITIDCTDGRHVVKREIISRIEKTGPDFIILNGHGDSRTFYGYENEPVIALPDASVFKGRIAFARACNCAEELGKEAVDRHGCLSFVGYRFEFVNVRQTDAEIKPLADEVSRPVWEASNAVPVSLIKGATVAEAVDASHRRADREILKLIHSTDPAAVHILKAILTNDAGLIYHGDGSAGIGKQG